MNQIIGDMDDDEVEHVEHFKYKQDLQRKLSVSSIIGLGFTLMGVPFGLSSTLWISLVDGGSVTILYGWLVVGFFSICVVLSLSEIIAKFPTAGGVYHFSAILSNEKYSSISSWFTGWFLLIGNWTMCILWSIGTVIVIDILLLIFAKKTNSAAHILTNFDNSRSGWPDPLAFIVGMQSSCFTLTGYGMLFSMTDEVKKPEKNMPRGAVSAVSMAVLQGLFFIIPILVILPSLTVLLDSNPEIMPIDLVFKTATESYMVSFLLIVLLIGTVLFQSIGALTTASRSTYVFARDGGLPFKEYWTQIDSVEEYTLPKNALFLSMGVIGIFSFLALISASAFNAFMGASVVSLALANGIPILCLMLNKRRKIKGSAFRLRYFGWIINGISVLWVFISFFILCLPPVIKGLSWRTMNYASVVLVILALIAFIGYKTWGANVFTGPVLDTDYLELHNLEAQAQKVKDFSSFAVIDEDDHEESMSQKPAQMDQGDVPDGQTASINKVSEKLEINGEHSTQNDNVPAETANENPSMGSSSVKTPIIPNEVEDILASGRLEKGDENDNFDDNNDDTFLDKDENFTVPNDSSDDNAESSNGGGVLFEVSSKNE
ncbi:hypothetical protein JCM33374_g4570 [Metschnikowia sp. JCM 33374]|nr:hypothetical protein JCM33374_g4570 [Metschnikowia sp. JCM 33374]